MTLTAAGSLGVGTPTPTNRLQIYAPAITTNDWNTYSARFSNNSDKGVIIGYDTTNSVGHIGSVSPGVAWTPLSINTNGGNVLIGTSTDSGYKLDVNGTGRFSGNVDIGTGDSRLTIGNTSSANTEAKVRLRTGSTKIAWEIGGQSLVDNALTITPSTAAGGTTFTTPVLTIASSGAATFSSSVTAKTSGDYRQATLGTSTGAALFITNTSYAGYGLLVGNSYSFGDAWLQVGRVDGTATAYNLLLQASGGKVLINTTTDDGVAKLEIDGDIYLKGSGGVYYFKSGNASTIYAWYGNSSQIRLYNNGIGVIGYFNDSSGVYVPSSDINRKKDFEVSTLGLKEVLQLKPTLYRMKCEDNTKKQLGFIAQEVKDIIPQAYSETGEGKEKFIGLDYQAITATLVKAIQEQQKQIEELKLKIK